MSKTSEHTRFHGFEMHSRGSAYNVALRVIWLRGVRGEWVQNRGLGTDERTRP
jgi:hypothetical protein